MESFHTMKVKFLSLIGVGLVLAGWSSHRANAASTETNGSAACGIDARMMR